MYRGLRVIAMAPVLDEEVKIGEVVRRTPRDVVDDLLVIDDGSTDRSAEVAREGGARVISMGRVAGVGAALRVGYAEALRGGYDVAVVMAGNNKDSPEEIPRLLDPIVDSEADHMLISVACRRTICRLEADVLRSHSALGQLRGVPGFLEAMGGDDSSFAFETAPEDKQRTYVMLGRPPASAAR